MNDLPKVECYGCGRPVVYLPCRVCTRCLMTGNVSEKERSSLEDVE